MTDGAPRAKPKPALPPAVEAEVRKVLARAARRMLKENRGETAA
jgi:hypothetical protein